MTHREVDIPVEQDDGPPNPHRHDLDDPIQREPDRDEDDI